MKSRVQIKIALSDHGRGIVTVNGVEIPQVQGILFSAAVGAQNTLTLIMATDVVTIEGPAVMVKKIMANPQKEDL